MPELSIAFQGNKQYEEYAALGALAEELGFDAISVYADLGFQPAIVPLLAIARATSRIRIGPAALNPFLLHPVEIAGQIAALDSASDGRAYLGLARGAWLDQIGVESDRPLLRIRECVSVVRHLLEGRDDGFTGAIYKLPGGRMLQYPVLRPNVPLLIGSWGERLLAYAGEVADEVKVGGSTNPDLVSTIRARVAPGAIAAERSPESIGIVFGAVTVCDEDGAGARAHARREVARYLPVVAPLDPTVDIPAVHLSRMAAFVQEEDLDAAAALVPDDILDRFAFSGTPAQIVRQATALFDAGVTRIEFGTPHGFTDGGGAKLLGERVLPALR